MNIQHQIDEMRNILKDFGRRLDVIENSQQQYVNQLFDDSDLVNQLIASKLDTSKAMSFDQIVKASKERKRPNYTQ